MKWKVIGLLSLFGLGMGIVTISLIPSRLEYIFWLPIFVVSALILAWQCNRAFFLNGFMVGLLNFVWVTAAHVIFAGAYLGFHKGKAAMMRNSPTGMSPTGLMMLEGPVAGIASGVLLGLLAFIAARLLKRRRRSFI